MKYWQWKGGWQSWEDYTDSNGYYLIGVTDYDSTASIIRVEAYSEDENGQEIKGTCGTYTIMDTSYFKVEAALIFGIASFNTGDDAYDNAIKLFSDLNSIRNATINAGYTPPYLDNVKCPDTTMEAWMAGCYYGDSNINLKYYSATQETLAHEYGHFVDHKKTGVKGDGGRWSTVCGSQWNTSETRAFSEGWADSFKNWYKGYTFYESACSGYSGLLEPTLIKLGFWDLQDSGDDGGREYCEISFSGILTNGMTNGVDTWPELTNSLKSYYSSSVDEQIDSVTAVNQLYESGLLMAEGGKMPSAALESSLYQNKPNPFNTTTTISFEVGGSDNRIVNLAVFDIRGKLVRVLVSGEREPGRHSVFWDGKDSNGYKVGSGVYFYRFENAGKVRTRKMVLIK